MRAARFDGSRRAAAGLLAAALLLFGAPLFAQQIAANPSMSDDFARMMDWLAHGMAQGIAFNAGSTFDPPHEIIDKRLAPDLSLGLGKMPFDKGKFPEPETQALKDLDATTIFPDEVMFPNVAMHLRAGLPWRSDFAIRLANMTTPPGYRLSPTTAGKGQSNSIGFSVRRHWFGGSEFPLLTVGAHFNHVYGRFSLKSKFNVDNIQGFSADSDVNGDLQWTISSVGLNAVTSQTFGRWTPFVGLGYNRASGSIRCRLEARPNTELISPIMGEGSEAPEPDMARFIMGGEYNGSWVNAFFNAEIKAIGIASSRTWIAHAGMQLPFKIGVGGADGYKDSARRRAKFVKVKIVDDDELDVMRSAPNDDAPVKRSRRSRERREVFRGGPKAPPSSLEESSSDLIFIQ